MKLFVEDSDQNLKYLGLVGMVQLMRSHPKTVVEHKELVLGCMGHTYCITVQPRFSVGEFKELVWEQEREHRDAEQDAREGFRVHRQRLVLERGLPDPASPRRNDPAAKPLRTPPGTADASRAARSHAPATFGTFLLGPEIRTLGWYNVTEYDLFFVLPAIPKASAEEVFVGVWVRACAMLTRLAHASACAKGELLAVSD